MKSNETNIEKKKEKKTKKENLKNLLVKKKDKKLFLNIEEFFSFIFLSFLIFYAFDLQTLH